MHQIGPLDGPKRDAVAGRPNDLVQTDVVELGRRRSELKDGKTRAPLICESDDPVRLSAMENTRRSWCPFTPELARWPRDVCTMIGCRYRLRSVAKGRSLRL